MSEQDLLKKLPPPLAVELDPEAGAVYIRFSEKPVKRTVSDSRSETILVIDLDEEGKVIGVEILGIDLSLRSIRRAAPELSETDFESAQLKPARLSMAS